MSVAVAQMPQTFQGGTTQAAGQPNLLEALLASCQKPTVSKQLPGYGRDLVSYFSSDKDIATPKAKSRGRSNTSSPQRTNRKATALATAMVAAAKKSSKSVNPKMTAAQAEKNRAIQMAAMMSSWAGPGFCVSPRADKLPAPTVALLD